MEDILDKSPVNLKGKDREDWLKKKQEEIMSKINTQTKSKEDILELLEFMSKFHNYSLNNLMLIEAQWSGAFAVASYDNWRKLGFPVKEGEKARIFIWVRTPFKIIILPNGDEVQWFKATKKQKMDANKGILKLRKGVSYKPGFVYDVSQTTATPEDLPKIFPNKHFDFNMDTINYESVLEGIDQIASTLSYEVFWDEDDILGNAKGGCVYAEKKILINKRNTNGEVVSVGFHELAHAYMHENSKLDRHLKELQAELVACMVSSYFGLDTLEKAANYIGSWMTRKKEDDDLKLDGLLKEVQKVSSQMIKIVNKELANNEENKKN